MIGVALGLILAAAGVADVPSNGPAARTAFAAATGRFYSAAYRACSAKAQSTVAMIDCRAAEAAKWDTRLNAAYNVDRRNFTPSERTALQKAQRAWIAFRDANCAAYEDPVEWGSLSRITAADCMLSMTAQRALELEDFPPSPCGRDSC